MLCAGSEHDASTQLRIIENCTKNDRVKINSKKTEILMINKKNKDINLQLFNEKIDEKQNIKHLGIERQEKNNPNVENRISVARATMYSLLGAGLHGINGTYKTQSITNRFDGTKSAECKLCMVGPEDYKHFLINCESLNCVRKIHQDRLKSLLEDNHIHYCSIIDSDEDLLELLVDCSRNDLITVPQQRET
ncbi:Hypothetical predicted protein [Mytilus galloprovincialis]|uniref:Reverse transcriptase zinc-binding domain-containing protein n=1 Tax=Mytilus galloprovincialis TaxID=29158 RepID=A0A8B6E330_MYTGA|nr:Hypothetical predicted protein [Mytilus galloprovincialis]